MVHRSGLLLGQAWSIRIVAAIGQFNDFPRVRPHPAPFVFPRNAPTLALLLVLAGAARADIDLPSIPPAQPEAATARVFLDESVEIPLRGVNRSGRPLEFLIRRAPSSGSLSEVTPTGRATAVVTYTPSARATAGVDRFRYAVRAPGTGVSTPAEVVIQLVERPPKLVAPTRLEFPSVALGDTASESFEIRNDGGGRVAGTLRVPLPWRLAEGDGAYSLGPGESASFTLAFQPTESRRHAETLRFSHDESAGIGLEGVGFTAIEIVPRQIRLEGDGRSETRSGEFLVRNISGVEREVHIAAPSSILVDDHITVAPQSEIKVALRTRSGFLDAINDALKFTSEDLRFSVPLKATAAPARLVASRDQLDFGTLVAGKFGREKLTLRNIGGSPVTLRATAPEGVLLQPDPSYEPLGPGQSRAFEITYARPSVGKLDDTLVFESDSLSVRVPVKATVKPDPRDQVNLAASADRRPAVKLNALPTVEQIGVTRQTHHEVDLTWKHVSPDAKRYVLILRRIIFQPDGKAAFQFEPLKDAKPRIVRNEVRATVGGLDPGEHITVLVVAYDAEGTPSQASPPFTLTSKPRPTLPIPWTWLGVAAIAGCLFLIVRERRRRHAALESEVSRMTAPR